ncbi:MAG: TrbI/VirB10 family protein [Alphaproteobacteria bacterium]
MKIPQPNKPNHNPNQIDPNEEEETIEVQNNGPSVASLKNNKITIIIASAILISAVLYIFFFKNSSNSQSQKVEEVLPPDIAPQVAPSDSGKSIFEFEKTAPKKEVQDPQLLKSQGELEVPSLPELPKDMVLPNELNLSPNIDQEKTPEKFIQSNPNDLQKQLDQQKPIDPTKISSEQNQSLINQQITNDQKIQQQNQQINPQLNPNQANQVNEEQLKKLEEKIRLDPRYTPIIVFSGGYTSPEQSVGTKDNIIQVKKNPINELKETQINVDATVITNSETTIAQGKMINAILETAINTEIQGIVRAIVSRDVYGESGNKVLIPRGSRLYGSYSSSIQRGQARVQIGWTRLIRPDGVSLDINFSASDQFGRAGIPGDVDNRYSSVIANSLLTSILTVGTVAAAQKFIGNANQNATTTVNQNQGITTTTTNATNQAIYDVTRTIIDTVGEIITNTMNLDPVIRIPQGTKITIIVNSDIRVPAANTR